MTVIGNYDVHTVYCVIGTTVHSNIEATTFFYRPCREEREGYVFTLVCYQVTTPPSLPPDYAQAGSTHPTGMHYCSYSSSSCFYVVVFVLIL